MKLINRKISEQGSSLVSVLVIMLVTVMILAAMVGLVGAVLLSLNGWRQTTDSLMAAESVTDDMLIRLARNPSTTPAAGEYLPFAYATGYPFLTPAGQSSPGTLIGRGVSGNYVRTIKVQYQFESDGRLTIISRQEAQ